MLVSDNGPCFTNLKFAEFTRENSIKHQLVRPYHQATNGQAESSVKIVKSDLRRMSGGTLETKLFTFLTLLQDNTPYHNWSYTSRNADEKEVTNKFGQVEAIHLYHCTPQPRSSEIPS